MTRIDDSSEDRGRRKRPEQLTFRCLSSYQSRLTTDRSPGGIKSQSEALSGKWSAARIFDKKQDSGMIVKLVGELRQTITIHQVSHAEEYQPA